MNETFDHKDDFLGKDILTLANKLSSSRAIMFSSQLEQALVLNRPEFPRIFTSYENEVGSYSSSFRKLNTNATILAKIPKFSFKPDYFYTLIIQTEDGKYDIIERKPFEKLTESYCYRYKNKVVDSKKVNDTISKDEVLYKSTSFDNGMNYGYGLNANVVYMVENNTIEDAIVVSESFAKRMSTSFVSEIEININKNDLLCNLYGKNIKEKDANGEIHEYDFYKGFPDVSERIKNGILASRRRINYEHALFDLQTDNLKKINYKTDILFYANGKVIDIDVYCNEDKSTLTKPYEQIVKYLDEQERFCREYLNVVRDIVKHHRKDCSENLLYHYKRCKDILNKKIKWFNNQTEFDNIIVNMKILYTKYLKVGSKLSGRFGR